MEPFFLIWAALLVQLSTARRHPQSLPGVGDLSPREPPELDYPDRFPFLIGLWYQV